MRGIFILFLCLSMKGTLVYCNDTCHLNKVDIVKNELLSYLDSSQKYSDEYARYYMYVISFYHTVPQNDDLSFTIGMICNRSAFDEVKATHYFEINKQTVLIRIADTTYLDLISSLGAKAIKEMDRVDFLNKLYFKKYSVLHSRTKVVLFQLVNCIISKEYTDNTLDIPLKKAIYSFDSSNFIPPVYKGNILRDSIDR